MSQDAQASSAAARELMRRGAAALGSLMDGAPYVSLVLTAHEDSGNLLLLLSDLAQHSRNIAAYSRVSLLFDGTEGLTDRLTGSRLTVMGSAARCDEPEALARYLEQQPSAAGYAAFRDFHLYRIKVERGHLVAGFGRIEWLDGEALRG